MKRALWLGLAGLTLGTGVGAGLIVRDCSLTCNVGYRFVPLAFLAIALIAVPFVALQVRWLTQTAFTQWQVRCALLAAASFLMFRGWTFSVVNANPYASPENPVFAIQAAYLTYYVWVDPVFVLLFCNLARTLRRIYGDEAERGVGVMVASVLAGGLVGSGLARVGIVALTDAGVQYEIARDHLMLVIAATLGLYAIVAAVIGKVFSGPSEAPPPTTAGFGDALRAIVADRRLLWAGAILVLTGAAVIALEYLFYWQVNDGVDVHANTGRTAWFAEFYMLMNGVSLVLLVFGTGRLLKWLGLTFGLLSLPVALLLGGAALFVQLSVVALCVVRIGKDGLLKTLYEPATELLMMQIDPDRYGINRTVLGGLGFSLGMGLMAAIVLGLTFGLNVGKPVLVGALVAACAAWIGAVVLQRRAGSN